MHNVLDVKEIMQANGKFHTALIVQKHFPPILTAIVI